LGTKENFTIVKSAFYGLAVCPMPFPEFVKESLDVTPMIRLVLDSIQS
jgi:hypothetical protein